MKYTKKSFEFKFKNKNLVFKIYNLHMLNAIIALDGYKKIQGLY